jgi:hypothetical protein
MNIELIAYLMRNVTTGWCAAAAELEEIGVQVKAPVHRYGEPGRPMFFVKGRQVFDARTAHELLG